MTAVALRDVSKIFPNGTLAVDNVSLDVVKGEFVVLLGPSGCGKSTMLRMIAGLESPTAGAIMLDGELINDVALGQRQVAMVFPDFALYPHLGVQENIFFPLRRRVAVGSAITHRPRLFLMDEPLSNLDAKLRDELRAEVSGLVRELGITTLYATDDPAEALTMADRVAVMLNGALLDVGTPTQVYARPATLQVAALVSRPRMNLLEASVHVHFDRYVELTLGEQSLQLPWDDVRTPAVSRYHGERIVVGMRAEVLTPVSPDTPDDVLHGRIRHLEHHGHESLCFLDIGASGPALDEPGDVVVGPPTAGTARQRRLDRLVRRFTVRPALSGPDVEDGWRHGVPHEVFRMAVPAQPQRHPAELAVRLAPYPAVAAGHPLTVSVRLDALHFFDGRGDRIDVGWR